MMNIRSVLTPNQTYAKQSITSKKRALESIASYLNESNPELDTIELFEALVAREKLGSTGLGNQIAIPHCHLKQASKPLSLLMTLDKPIDFDAIDDQPVDILFTLVVPEGQEEAHLQLLASVAEQLSNPETVKKLRQIDDPQLLYETFTSKPT